jgi:hypothetical protein
MYFISYNLAKANNRLEVAATRDFTCLRRLKTLNFFLVHGGGLCLCSSVRPWRAGGSILFAQYFYSINYKSTGFTKMTTHFITAEIDLQETPTELLEVIETELKKQGEPLRWAVTSVDVDEQKATVEAVVTKSVVSDSGALSQC